MLRPSRTCGAAGATFRNDIVTGPGGKQILLEDPDGNPIELFEAAAMSTSASDDPRRRAVSLGNGRRPERDPGERRRDDADGARALPTRPPAGDGRVVRAAAHRGGRGRGQADAYDEIFHPIAERVLARCDACLRIGGPSEGADRMVRGARELGKQVFTDMAELP